MGRAWSLVELGMSASEWSRLTPAKIIPYVLAWAEKRKREQDRLEAIDMMAAQIAWATVAPYQDEGEQSTIADWRVFRAAKESRQKRTTESAEEKERKLIEQARLAHAAAKHAAKRRAERKQKRESLKDGKK